MFTALLLVLSAAPDAFPWSGPQTLRGNDGTSLTWKVNRIDGQVVIEGTHTRWSVVHVARSDGTPISTVKTVGGKTARIRYYAGRADFQPAGTSEAMVVKEAGLWDSESLDVRLAGMTWTKGAQVRFKILDPDSADGAVYAMLAEGLGVEQCGKRSCQAVRLTLDGWRRPFGPTIIFRYAADASAEYLANVSDGKELDAP